MATNLRASSRIIYLNTHKQYGLVRIRLYFCYLFYNRILFKMDNKESFVSKCARIAPIVIMTGWGALGFWRGWGCGVSYGDKFFYGFGCAGFYTTPLTVPISIYLELWNQFKQ